MPPVPQKVGSERCKFNMTGALEARILFLLDTDENPMKSQGISCPRCGKVFDRQSVFMRHAGARNLCDATVSDIPRDKLIGIAGGDGARKCPGCGRDVSAQNFKRHWSWCGGSPRQQLQLQQHRGDRGDIFVAGRDLDLNLIGGVAVTTNTFGRESLAHLKNEVLLRMFGDVVGLTRLIHFNAEAPENRNIRVQSRDRALVFRGDDLGWQPIALDEVVEKCSRRGVNIFLGIADDRPDAQHDADFERMRDLESSSTGPGKEVRTRLRRDVFLGMGRIESERWNEVVGARSRLHKKSRQLEDQIAGMRKMLEDERAEVDAMAAAFARGDHLRRV